MMSNIAYRTPACDKHLDLNESDICPFCKIEELEAQIKLLQQDVGFFRCCAFSGETPTEGAEPSARFKGEGDGDQH